MPGRKARNTGNPDSTAPCHKPSAIHEEPPTHQVLNHHKSPYRPEIADVPCITHGPHRKTRAPPSENDSGARVGLTHHMRRFIDPAGCAGGPKHSGVGRTTAIGIWDDHVPVSHGCTVRRSRLASCNRTVTQPYGHAAIRSRNHTVTRPHRTPRPRHGIRTDGFAPVRIPCREAQAS